MSEAANGVAIPTQAAGTQTQPGESKQTGNIGSTEALEAQSAGAEAKAAAREAIRKLKLKHDDGTEEEIDEQEAVRVYKERKKHQAVASKELNEGKAEKKKAEALLNALKDKQNLFEALKQLGHDPRQLSEEYLANVLEDEMLDPKDKELKEWRRKDAESKEKEKQRVLAEQEKMHNEMKQKFSARYTEQFTKALDVVKVPKNKQTVAKMAEYISRAAKDKIEMTAEEAAKLVREDIQEYQRSVYGEMDAEELMKILGEQGLNKIRAIDISKLKSPEANLRTPTEQGEIRKKEPQGRMSEREWRRHKMGR